MSCRMRSVFFSRKPFSCVCAGGGGREGAQVIGGSCDLRETL